jgi:hypothetical protein
LKEMRALTFNLPHCSRRCGHQVALTKEAWFQNRCEEGNPYFVFVDNWRDQLEGFSRKGRGLPVWFGAEPNMDFLVATAFEEMRALTFNFPVFSRRCGP